MLENWLSYHIRENGLSKQLMEFEMIAMFRNLNSYFFQNSNDFSSWVRITLMQFL